MSFHAVVPRQCKRRRSAASIAVYPVTGGLQSDIFLSPEALALTEIKDGNRLDLAVGRGVHEGQFLLTKCDHGNLLRHKAGRYRVRHTVTQYFSEPAEVWLLDVVSATRKSITLRTRPIGRAV